MQKVSLYHKKQLHELSKKKAFAQNSKKYKETTNSKHNLPIYPNLLGQQFKVKQPGQVGGADVSFKL